MFVKGEGQYGRLWALWKQLPRIRTSGQRESLQVFYPPTKRRHSRTFVGEKVSGYELGHSHVSEICSKALLFMC